MKTKIAFLMVAAALLAGCATQTKITGSLDDYGKYPSNYTNIVQTYITETFKDPDSVKGLEINAPTKYINKHEADYGVWGKEERDRTYGYLIFFWANAKNSYGGYTGRQDFSLFVRDDIILESHNLTADVDSLSQ